MIWLRAFAISMLLASAAWAKDQARPVDPDSAILADCIAEHSAKSEQVKACHGVAALQCRLGLEAPNAVGAAACFVNETAQWDGYIQDWTIQLERALSLFEATVDIRCDPGDLCELPMVQFRMMQENWPSYRDNLCGLAWNDQATSACLLDITGQHALIIAQMLERWGE